jgi:hypothetical protein
MPAPFRPRRSSGSFQPLDAIPGGEGAVEAEQRQGRGIVSWPWEERRRGSWCPGEEEVRAAACEPAPSRDIVSLEDLAHQQGLSLQHVGRQGMELLPVHPCRHGGDSPLQAGAAYGEG